MSDIETGQVWEVYSTSAKHWARAILMKVEDGEATLRYEGSLELLTVNVADLQNKPERFRPADAADSSC